MTTSSARHRPLLAALVLPLLLQSCFTMGLWGFYPEDYYDHVTGTTEAGFTYGHPGGAFYIYTNVSSTGIPSPLFCERLLQETGVMLFPGDMFGDPSSDYIRISYLQPLPLIQEAMERIASFTIDARSAT